MGIFWWFLLNSAQQIDTLHAQRANDIETQNMAFSYTFPTIYNTTNRPCEAVGVNEANGFLLPIVLLLEIAQIEKDLPGGFVGFVHLVVMLNLPLVIYRSLRLLS